MDREPISPMVLAKELGVRPQIIYQAIRKHQIHSWNDENGKTMVDKTAATRFLQGMKHRMTAKEKEAAKEAGTANLPRQEVIREGVIASWDAQPAGFRRYSQIEKATNNTVEFRDTRGKTLTALTDSVAERIAKGLIVIEQPVQLLDMIVAQYTKQNNPVAQELKKWIEEHREQLEPPIQEQKGA